MDSKGGKGEIRLLGVLPLLKKQTNKPNKQRKQKKWEKTEVWKLPSATSGLFPPDKPVKNWFEIRSPTKQVGNHANPWASGTPGRFSFTHNLSHCFGSCWFPPADTHSRAGKPFPISLHSRFNQILFLTFFIINLLSFSVTFTLEPKIICCKITTHNKFA